MINAVIIDDESDSRFLIRSYLTKYFNESIKLVGEADDVGTGIETIKSSKPEIVFLDIKMPSGTGFDVLMETKDLSKFEVIFITAHDDFAIKAFQFSAFGYLLKPIKVTEFRQLVERLVYQVSNRKTETNLRLKILIENYGDDRKIKKIVVSNMEGFQVLNIEEILRLEGDKNYTHFIMSDNKKITTSKTIGEYEELLDEFGFFRAHQSTIINLRHVKSFKKSDELIEMKDGKLIKLSRHRKSEFMARFI